MIELEENSFDSVNKKLWSIKDIDNLKVTKLIQEFDIDDLLARFICSRNIDFNNVSDFLNPSLKKQIPSPFIISDMSKGADRIVKAILNKEKIAIFGDYDVDGATSTALLGNYFSELDLNYEIYIPDRKKDGYGPSKNSFQHLINKNVKLIFTVDCGTL